MDHSKMPSRKLTNQLITDFNNELDRYKQMTPEQAKKITVEESTNLVKLGHGIPLNMISGKLACKSILRQFLDIGGPYQLREYIHCEQYITYMTGTQ
jgi:hypothetical protein